RRSSPHGAEVRLTPTPHAKAQTNKVHPEVPRSNPIGALSRLQATEHRTPNHNPHPNNHRVPPNQIPSPAAPAEAARRATPTTHTPTTTEFPPTNSPLPQRRERGQGG